MPSSLDHVSEDDLEQYCLGLLPPADVETLEEHLLICAECQVRLDETGAYVRAVKRAARRLREEGSTISTRPFRPVFGTITAPRLAWGLAAVLAAAAVLWVSGVRVWTRPVSGPPLAVVLHAFRSEDGGAVVPQRRPLVMEADAAAELPRRLDAEIVTAAGAQVARRQVQARDGRVTIPVPGGLSRGAYWVRLLDAGRNGDVLREYSLRVE